MIARQSLSYVKFHSVHKLSLFRPQAARLELLFFVHLIISRDASARGTLYQFIIWRERKEWEEKTQHLRDSNPRPLEFSLPWCEFYPFATTAA